MNRTELDSILIAHKNWLTGSEGQCEDLEDADLKDADLRFADLRSANLRGADLEDADLRYVKFFGADLQGVNLQGANLPDYDFLPTTPTFTAYKKVSSGAVLKLRVNREDAVCSLIGRKCRASRVFVEEAYGSGPYTSTHDPFFRYEIGESVQAPLDTDIRVECTTGVHFFLTRDEAEDY